MTADSELVRIPCLSPLLRVTVNGGKEEMMKEPYVAGTSWIEPVIGLEVEEKYFPLFAKTVCNIVPQALDASIVDAPLYVDERRKTICKQ